MSGEPQPRAPAAVAASIRGRLLRWLLPLLLLILVAGSLLDYQRAVDPVEAAYDQALADAALAVSARLHLVGERVELDLSDQSISVLRADTLDRVYFKVIGPGGNMIGGDPDLAGPAAVMKTSFFDGTYRGRRVRGVAQPVPTAIGPTLVLVAETTAKRDRARRDLVTTRVVQDLVIVALTVLVVWLVVGVALRPVERIAAQMQSRSAGDLQPLATTQAPQEIRPLIEALNHLFGLIGETQDGQRRFIENAAHQLRTPLTGLRGQVDLAIGAARAVVSEHPAAERSVEALRGRLGQISEATTRVTHLANQLLTLARSDRPSHDTASRQRVRLQDLAAESVATHIDDAVAREQDLGAESEPVALRAVAWELRELLGNLVDNAIAHSPRGGRITVRCGLLSGAPFLEVEDTGPGIPHEERERVFERFYRSPSAPPGGAGLGLAIVREIASLYGATVSVLDAAQPPGLVLRVVFPEALRSASPAEAGET